jgi:hypothetical protein
MKESDYDSVFIFCIITLIIAAGGRHDVGADYPIYKSMYQYGFSIYTTYNDVWHKATFQPNSMEIEWLYVLINKIFFDLGLPYYFVTFFMATTSLLIVRKMINKYSYFRTYSFLFYFFPIYFIAECGQMRQGVGGAIVLYSLHFIIERKLFKFLLTIFIALGFHKSSIVFIPAYWIVLLPMNANKWLLCLIGSIFLAPFEIHTAFGGLIDSIAPQDVSNAYNGYSNDRYYGAEMKTGFADAINLFFISFLLVYDKLGTKKVPYYEYYRNLVFFGYCLFYILRGNTIFATRLPGSYFGLAGYFMIPAIYHFSEANVKKIIRLILFFYVLAFFILFSKGNGKRGNFTIDRYQNYIWKSN